MLSLLSVIKTGSKEIRMTIGQAENLNTQSSKQTLFLAQFVKKTQRIWMEKVIIHAGGDKSLNIDFTLSH